MRTCTKCGVTKSLEDFHKDKTATEGRTFHCKECAKARARKWNADNADRKTASREAYYSKPENVAHNREYKRLRRVIDGDAKRAADREYAAKTSARAVERVRQWRIANPERARRTRREDNNRRRAQMLNAFPAWADMQVIEKVYDEADRITEQTGMPYEVDHVIPLLGKTVCGLHVQTNLRIIPQTVNRRKSAKVVPELLAEMVADCIARFGQGE